MTAGADDPAALRAEIARLNAELADAGRRIAELEVRASIDALTDVLNRRGFERELARALAYLARYGGSAALVYIDLDRFKAVNDRHGHAAGDELLREVGRALTANVRAADAVGRLGGDEFAVLLWNLSEAQAQAKARALEDIVAAAGIGGGAQRVAVGASAGAVPLAPAMTPAALIEAADRAMYARKAERRGR